MCRSYLNIINDFHQLLSMNRGIRAIFSYVYTALLPLHCLLFLLGRILYIEYTILASIPTPLSLTCLHLFRSPLTPRFAFSRYRLHPPSHHFHDSHRTFNPPRTPLLISEYTRSPLTQNLTSKTRRNEQQIANKTVNLNRTERLMHAYVTTLVKGSNARPLLYSLKELRQYVDQFP